MAPQYWYTKMTIQVMQWAETLNDGALKHTRGSMILAVSAGMMPAFVAVPGSDPNLFKENRVTIYPFMIFYFVNILWLIMRLPKLYVELFFKGCKTAILFKNMNALVTLTNFLPKTLINPKILGAMLNKLKTVPLKSRKKMQYLRMYTINSGRI